MSEITKLYENAGIEPYRIRNSCIDDNGNKITNSKNCSFRNLCGNACDEPRYILTTRKQLELVKFLLKVEHSISYYFYENRYGFVIDDKQDNCIEAERFEIALASMVNFLWQDLTEEEKQQVKGILE